MKEKWIKYKLEGGDIWDCVAADPWLVSVWFDGDKSTSDSWIWSVFWPNGDQIRTGRATGQHEAMVSGLNALLILLRGWVVTVKGIVSEQAGSDSGSKVGFDLSDLKALYKKARFMQKNNTLPDEVRSMVKSWILEKEVAVLRERIAQLESLLPAGEGADAA